MRSTLGYRINCLTWLSAAALGAILSIGLGCTSANRPQSSPFAADGPAVGSATAGGSIIGSGVESAAVGPADLPAAVAAEDAAAVEDPQVAAAFARLAQARAEMAQQPRVASTPTPSGQQQGALASGISAQLGDSRLTDFGRAATMTARDRPWPSPEFAVPASVPAWSGTR